MLISDDMGSLDASALLRKLEQQVLDVRVNGKNNFRLENLQKLYRPHSAVPESTKGSSLSCDPDSRVYHEHLNASFQAFQIRKWRPLTQEDVPQKTLTRCRPVSGRPTSSHGASYASTLPQRPSSEPVLSRPSSRLESASYLSRRPDTPRVDPGNFDTLSPRILSQFVTDPRPSTPLSTYGDVVRIKSRRSRTTRTKRTQADGAGASRDSDLASISDLDSDLVQFGSFSDDDDGDDDDDDDDSSDNDSISELEKGNEPPLDYNRKVPDLHLRPERLDNVYTPENKRDLRRFDFDAEKVDIPLYEFESPIPAPFNRINFRFHARENSDWRFATYAMGPVDPVLGAMFDRLVEIEKRQIETEEWEERKLRQVRRRHTSRVASASKARDKRCCHACLQPACVGDCPAKRVPLNCCNKCHQPLCTGTCTETKYEQRMRQPREEVGSALPPRPTVPRNCRTCQQRHNAKYINANNILLGRPNSAFSTYSRGQNSAKPKDLRPKSALDMSMCLSKGLEKIGLEPLQPTPPSTAKPARPRSRGALMPGKSYSSNLSRSLTDLSAKRCKSARVRKTVLKIE